MKRFPIVCVGGSAGGLDAYIRLLKHLPADMGVAIVIVNHITIMAYHLHVGKLRSNRQSYVAVKMGYNLRSSQAVRALKQLIASK